MFLAPEWLWFKTVTLTNVRAIRILPFPLRLHCARASPYTTLGWPGGRITRSWSAPLQWAAYLLASELKTSLEYLAEQHLKLRNNVTKFHSVASLGQEFGQWSDARDAIDLEVERLMLRHLLPGRCKLCPE